MASRSIWSSPRSRRAMSCGWRSRPASRSPPRRGWSSPPRPPRRCPRCSSTATASSRCSRTSWRMRSSTRLPAPSSSSGRPWSRSATRAGSASASRTRGRGSTRRTCPASSSRSSPGGAAAPVSASPSCRRSSSSTTARSSRAICPRAGRCSPSSCRTARSLCRNGKEWYNGWREFQHETTHPHRRRRRADPPRLARVFRALAVRGRLRAGAGGGGGPAVARPLRAPDRGPAADREPGQRRAGADPLRPGAFAVDPDRRVDRVRLGGDRERGGRARRRRVPPEADAVGGPRRDRFGADAGDGVSLWDRIIEPDGLTTVFQPIFRIAGEGRSTYAYEALTRGPKGTNIERSDVLFEYVRRKHRESEVDLLSIAAALRESRHLPGEPSLSLNVHASTLERDDSLAGSLAMLCAEHEVPLERIIIEIVEHAPPWSGPQLLASLAELRALGVRIALDDVGLGQ